MTAANERVPLSEVRDLIVVGEALPFRVLDAGERLLLNQGQVVATERQFDALLERGAWVERPVVEQLRRERAGAAAAAMPVAERQATLFDRWDAQVRSGDEMMHALAKGQTDAARITALAEALLALIDREPDVAVFLCIRRAERHAAPYAATHAMHAAVLAAFAARQLGWPAPRVLGVVGAALTMNTTMTELQGQLAEQRDPPSARQLEHVRAHPHTAERLLREAGVADAEWLQAVREHHERADGSGYPLGLQAVSEMAELLRAADVFMAKLSPRAARPAMVPQMAARQLFQQAGGAALATALVRSIGLHPPGTLVRLASGEIGVVSRRRSGSTPPVATLTNRRGQPVADTQHRDTALPEFAISAPLLDTRPFDRVLPERVYGMILA